MKLLSKSKSKLLVAMFALIAIIGCKANTGSNTESFVGLEAVNPECKGNEASDACSFLLLQQWFNGQIPVDEAAAQYGTISYKVHHKFTDYAYAQMPPAYREGLIKYYQQQIDRVHQFQLAKSNPAERIALLKVEAFELYDILRVLIEVDYKPVTNDLLAHLISQPNLRNFFDRFSVDLLWRLYRRPIRDLIAGLDQERVVFENLLIKTYVTSDGAEARFEKELAVDCAKLLNFINALGKTPIANCTPASSTLGLAAGPQDITSAAAGLTGSGQKFVSAVAGLVAANGPVGADGLTAAPKLSIFGGRDVAAGAPSGAPGTTSPPGSTPVPGALPTPAPMVTPVPNGFISALPPQFVTILDQLLGPGWSSMIPSTATIPGFNTSLALDSSTTVKKPLPRRPRIVCNKTGIPQIICQRYGATLPDVDTLVTGNTISKDPSAGNISNSFGAVGGYNFFIVGQYFTKIQDQGPNGACSAYGLAHTIIANLQRAYRGFTMSAADQWVAQGERAKIERPNDPNGPAYMHIAISTAKSRDLGGHRLVSEKSLTTLAEIKAVLDQGRAVYASSEVDDSWTTMYSPGTALSCGIANAEAGHAYSLQGYDDAKEWLILKNSWGDGWGEEGYGYLPYYCITSKFQKASYYDLTVQ